MKIFSCAAAPAPYVDRRENSPVHRHKVWSEGDDHLPLGRKRELLVEFCHVPVMAYTIGMKALRDFREQHALPCSPPCSRHTRLGVDDNFVEFDRLVLDQRDQRKLCARGVASGICNEPRVFNRAPMDFSEAVDCFPLKFWSVMLVAVPFRVSRR